jgi:hypothetical protein
MSRLAASKLTTDPSARMEDGSKSIRTASHEVDALLVVAPVGWAVAGETVSGTVARVTTLRPLSTPLRLPTATIPAAAGCEANREITNVPAKVPPLSAVPVIPTIAAGAAACC